MMAPSNIDRLQVSQNQGMSLNQGVPRGTSAKMMKHELQMLPVEHIAKLSRVKLDRKIRGNTKHQLHTIINRRQRNGWTTEIQAIAIGGTNTITKRRHHPMGTTTIRM